MATTLAFANVHDACVAFSDGRISEDELIQDLVALPSVKQAPLPDAEWFDGIIVNQGPVYDLRHESYAGLISADVYVRAAEAMLDAGHAA